MCLCVYGGGEGGEVEPVLYLMDICVTNNAQQYLYLFILVLMLLLCI